MKLVSRIIGIGLVFTILTTGCGLVGNPQADLPAVNNVEEAPPVDEESVKENTIPDGWPAGVFTADSDEAFLRLYSLDGTQAGELSIPGVEGISPEGMHVTSPWVDSTSLPSIVYRQWVPTQSIMSASGGVSEKLTIHHVCFGRRIRKTARYSLVSSDDWRAWAAGFRVLGSCF